MRVGRWHHLNGSGRWPVMQVFNSGICDPRVSCDPDWARHWSFGLLCGLWRMYKNRYFMFVSWHCLRSVLSKFKSMFISNYFWSFVLKDFKLSFSKENKIIYSIRTEYIQKMIRVVLLEWGHKWNSYLIGKGVNRKAYLSTNINQT